MTTQRDRVTDYNEYNASGTVTYHRNTTFLYYASVATENAATSATDTSILSPRRLCSADKITSL